jgi:7-cyano-7-deazaguanine synthase
MSKKALVLLSGGQDSTTALFWAKQNFDQVEVVTFDYGQRHRIELDAAQKIAELAKVKQTVLPINTFAAIGQNALTDSEMKIEQKDGELPSTFVPGRNLIFLTYAAAQAYTSQIKNLVAGVCQTDYSGYPDCRQDTVKSLEQSIQLGMDYAFKIHTPLMYLTKKETVELAVEVGAMEALSYSHTCYEGMSPPCGKCPACILRAKGFAEAGVKDPLLNK